ncbi:hypothetical protein TELCIR_03669 [Teladorsagia circumcincta]|uniref:Uncharacterized protein n=1 Tax=Teladorsagia circumcincta TaxID=45464 RepID=A0A2G9UW04_TELCI|nr:hypothetical protein TELCIR_03669 [Teladorsagia circumcincta]
MEHLGHGHKSESHAVEEEEISSESLTATDSPGRIEDFVEEHEEGIERLYVTASEDVRHVIGEKLKASSDGCSKLQGKGSKEAYHCLRKIDDVLSKALTIIAGTKEPNDYRELHPKGNIKEQEMTKQLGAISAESRSEMEPKETETRTPTHHIPPTTECDTNDTNVAVMCDVCGQMEPVVCELGVRRAMIDWMLCDDCGTWVHMSCAKTRECSSCREGYFELDHPVVIAKKRSES